MESPIDLHDDIIKPEEIEPFVIDDIDKQIYAEVINTGEGLNISVSAQNSPIIRGGGLPYPEYVVFQILFRWDSEHTVNREKFAMEVQTLTIAKECRNFENASVKGGVAIFSTLYSLSGLENEGLNELLPIIPFISDEVNRSVPYDVLRLSHFFPKNLNEFYRYNGSLTFPPFSSGVTWTIFKEKQPVTRPQMGLLCDILDDEGNLIVCNNSVFRNVKTVLYSSGKIRLKCQCPSRERKHRSKERKQEKYDVPKKETQDEAQKKEKPQKIGKREAVDLEETVIISETYEEPQKKTEKDGKPRRMSKQGITDAAKETEANGKSKTKNDTNIGGMSENLTEKRHNIREKETEPDKYKAREVNRMSQTDLVMVPMLRTSFDSDKNHAGRKQLVSDKPKPNDRGETIENITRKAERDKISEMENQSDKSSSRQVTTMTQTDSGESISQRRSMDLGSNDTGRNQSVTKKSMPKDDTDRGKTSESIAKKEEIGKIKKIAEESNKSHQVTRMTQTDTEEEAISTSKNSYSGVSRNDRNPSVPKKSMPKDEIDRGKTSAKRVEMDEGRNLEEKPDHSIPRQMTIMTQTDLEDGSISTTRSFDLGLNTAGRGHRKLSASVSFRLSPSIPGSEEKI